MKEGTSESASALLLHCLNHWISDALQEGGCTRQSTIIRSWPKRVSHISYLTCAGGDVLRDSKSFWKLVIGPIAVGSLSGGEAATETRVSVFRAGPPVAG